MASHQILNVLIPGSIVIIIKELTKDNVQQSEDFTNTKTSMEIDAKKDSELIRIIGVYAPLRERSFGVLYCLTTPCLRIDFWHQIR